MKETEHREFKKSLAELKAGLISIAAILNKHGRGELWFGIGNDGKVIGLEIRNPGGLFGGITIADLRKGHVSKRRNPLIADLFRRKANGDVLGKLLRSS